MKRVVIIGANGFIGSYLSNYLTRKGYEITAVSRTFSDKAKQEIMANDFIECDILTKDILNLKIRADFVIHLASANDIVSKDVLKGLELSVVGTKRVLDFAINNNISNFIFFSTAQVYGSNLEGNIDENSELNPMNDYALNHIFAEDYVKMYSNKGLIKGIVVRPTNVYGRFIHKNINRWSLVPGCFCKEAFTRRRITLKTSGKQIRNFISLDNVSRACEVILNNFPKNYEVFNISSNNYYRIVDVAKIVKQVYKELFNDDITISTLNDFPKESNKFSISNSKIKNLGFYEDQSFDLTVEIIEIFKLLTANGGI